MTTDEYNRLISKNRFNPNSKDLSKVTHHRTMRYATMNENEIPELDFFLLPEYGKVNLGYKYVVFNYDKESFRIIGKKQIRPEKLDIVREERISHETVSRAASDPTINEYGNGRHDNRIGTERFGNRRIVRENDSQDEAAAQTFAERYTDDSRSIIRSKLKFSSRDTEHLELAKNPEGNQDQLQQLEPIQGEPAVYTFLYFGSLCCAQFEKGGSESLLFHSLSKKSF